MFLNCIFLYVISTFIKQLIASQWNKPELDFASVAAAHLSCKWTVNGDAELH